MVMVLYKRIQLHMALCSQSTTYSWAVESKFISKMDLFVYIQLLILCVLNTIFTFSGIVLNILVIACFWKSSQLRRKLCHFMIMVLSCFDLVTVATNHPGLFLFLISWLTEAHGLFSKMRMYLHFADAFLGFSFFTLLVMNIERYLGTYYPIYHHTSVTRRKLVTIVAMLLIFQITLTAISVNNWLISYTAHLIIFVVIIFPTFAFINFKLFSISRNARRMKSRLSEKRTKKLKNISTCLLAAVCNTFVFIPSGVFIVYNISTGNKSTSDAMLIYVWSTTIFTMNSTFNSLIFFWKNGVLKTEGVKILKMLKDHLVRA